jgi:signal peptidase I
VFDKKKENKLEAKLHDFFGPAVGTVVLFFLEVIQIMVISALIIIPIRYFIIQPFYVKGASMEPSFYASEYLIIDELSLHFRTPVRGEVIVFRYPEDLTQHFIKRVIGMPGEEVVINNGEVTIINEDYPNGFIIEEDYLKEESTRGKIHVVLGSEEYYVMGDNRDHSLDSRNFGPVEEDHIVGRVWVRGLPVSRFTVFTDVPEYLYL